MEMVQTGINLQAEDLDPPLSKGVILSLTVSCVQEKSP